ncbi:MAG: DUF998 domain-containing protein [Promethearchaeota archaeon]
MALQVKLTEWFDELEEWIYNIDDKFDGFLDKTYKNIHGMHFGTVGLLIYALSTLIAVLLYLSVDSSYSIFTHWISHLGDGPNGANIVFNIGWIISSGILLFFLVHEIRELRKKGAIELILDTMLLAAVAFSAGLLLVGLFPLHLGIPHTVAATFYFIGGFTYFLLYGIILLTIPVGGKIRSFFAFITVACHLLYFLSPIITIYTVQIGITMNFLEWMVLISEVSVLLVMLSYYYINKVQERKINEFKVKAKSWIKNDWTYKNELVEYIELFYK